MSIAPGDKFLETHLGLANLHSTLLVAMPADGQWGIDRQEEEEWPSDEDIKGSLGGDVGGNEAASPMLCHEVEKFFRGGEGVRLSSQGECSLR